MGDRTYLTLNIPTKALAIPEVLESLEKDLPASWEETCQTNEVDMDESFACIEISEVNYGELDCFPLLTKLGIPYNYNHTGGDEYQAQELSFDGEEFTGMYLDSSDNGIIEISSVTEALEKAKAANDFSILDEFIDGISVVQLDFKAIHENEKLWVKINAKRIVNKLKRNS